jgi:hypothetical protein
LRTRGGSERIESPNNRFRTSGAVKERCALNKIRRETEREIDREVKGGGNNRSKIGLLGSSPQALLGGKLSRIL